MEQDGSANRYAESGLEIKAGQNYQDLGDLIFEKTDREYAFELISNAVGSHVADGSQILSLGGDHSISYPVINAVATQHPGLNILHLDAHADLYDNFDDNPYSHASPFARLMETGKINSLIQVGIRTLNQHQRAQAERFGIQIIEMKDFHFDFLNRLKTPLYLSLDLDALDPAYAPGVSHHEPGGMSTRSVIDLIQKIPVQLVGADIVEYNPMRDLHQMTGMVAYKMMKELISKMIKI